MTSGLRKGVFFILLLGVTWLAYQYWIKPAHKKLAEKKTKVQSKFAKLERITIFSRSFEKIRFFIANNTAIFLRIKPDCTMRKLS